MKTHPPTLDEIALTTNTDKSTRLHSYTLIYHDLFAHRRNQPISLLEVGILGGDSLRMWAAFFAHPAARFVGVDIHDRGFVSEDKRIQTIYADAGQAMVLAGLPGPFDIAIDDGSHFTSHQVTFFEAVWPLVNPGGIMVIEDVHSCHSPQHQDMHMDFPSFIARLFREMQDEKGATGCAAPDPKNARYDIAGLELRRGLAIIRKRA